MPPRDLAALHVDETFRACVHQAASRLGQVRIVAAPSWMALVDRLGLPGHLVADAGAAAALVVGTPADVLRHAATELNDFAFVMPVAQLAKPWQRARPWRDDTTLDLWRAGWSLLAIDRLFVARDEATVEFVIGNARQTPTGSS